MTRTFPAFRRDRRPCLIAIALGAALVGGCAPVSDLARSQTATPAEADLSVSNTAPAAGQEMAPATDAAKIGATEPLLPVGDVGQPTPQLVKQASLVLVSTDLDRAIAQVQTLVRQAQGDVLSLQDHRSPDGAPQQVSLTLRVPQAELDGAIEALRSLGTVQQQSLTAEDVSSQLVDLDARLKNLRQSEAALLKIMERSGEIAHVLEVARELSTVREAIERLAAQQQNLQRQVAYAQIFLTLQSPVTAVPPLRPIDETLGNTWATATAAVATFTVSGLKLGLWLLAFSPYWGLLALAGYGGYRLWARPQSAAVVAETEQP